MQFRVISSASPGATLSQRPKRSFQTADAAVNRKTIRLTIGKSPAAWNSAIATNARNDQD